MAALTGTDTAAPRPDARPRRRRPTVGRWLVLLVAAGYFIVPLWSAVRFTLRAPGSGSALSAYTSIPSLPGFSHAIGLSLRLALITTVLVLAILVPTSVYLHLRLPRLLRLVEGTTVLVLAILVPTSVYLHLRLPRLLRLVEGTTVLPIVVPPVVLIVGVLQVAPDRLKGTPYLLALEYVVLAFPFAFRSLDAGLRAIDLRTLVEASRSLGGGWATALLRVVLPNLRSALLSATVLTVALVLGEFTMASLDQYQTFPSWVVAFQQDDARVSVAVSLLALVVTWLMLLLISTLDRRRVERGRSPSPLGEPT